MKSAGVLALTIKDFCSVYSIGRTLAYREIKEGRLRVRKVGKRTLILRVDAEAWAEGLAGPPHGLGSGS